MIKLNGWTNSKFHWYPSPMMGNGCKWGVNALNNACIWSHTTHQNVIVEFLIISRPINTKFGTNYKFDEFQNDWIPCEHVAQGPHVSLGKTSPTLLHPSIYAWKRKLHFHLNHLALCTTQPCPLGVNPIESSFVCKYVMIGASSCKSKAPSPFDSIFTLKESPIFMSICILKAPQQGI